MLGKRGNIHQQVPNKGCKCRKEGKERFFVLVGVEVEIMDNSDLHIINRSWYELEFLTEKRF
jgi:hypothetical protein